MGERLIPKLDRIGAEAGIKQMTPEIYNFALRVRADVVAQWPERPWVGLTDEEQQQAYEQWQNDGWGVFYKAIETKLKEKNT